MKYPALKDMITKMDQKNGEIIDSCVDVTINATMIIGQVRKKKHRNTQNKSDKTIFEMLLLLFVVVCCCLKFFTTGS